MISFFRVRGKSMEPLVQEGDFVVAESMSYLFLRPRVGQVVLARHPARGNMLLVKRIVAENQGCYWLEGDNSLASEDSRALGWFQRGDLKGKVIHKTGSLGHSIIG